MVADVPVCGDSARPGHWPLADPRPGRNMLADLDGRSSTDSGNSLGGIFDIGRFLRSECDIPITVCLPEPLHVGIAHGRHYIELRETDPL